MLDKKKNVLIDSRGYTFQQWSNIQLKLLVEKILSSKKIQSIPNKNFDPLYRQVSLGQIPEWKNW